MVCLVKSEANSLANAVAHVLIGYFYKGAGLFWLWQVPPFKTVWCLFSLLELTLCLGSSLTHENYDQKFLPVTY